MAKGEVTNLGHELDDTRDQTERRPLHGRPRRLFAVWSNGSCLLEAASLRQVLIGRGSECQLRIDDPSVSRRHAILYLEPALVVEDCGSTNGTSVGGSRVAPKQRRGFDYDTPISIGAAVVVLQRVIETPEVAAAEHVAVETNMGRTNKLIELLSKSLLSVLIVGETGVGKEVATDQLHALSNRTGPLVKINCAALPEPLLEAELFGYERGAFTGATSAKPGLVESADGGTVFLDEIGELPLPTQAKLLRVLEAREVQRLGALRARSVDVRFVGATNRNLESLVRTGRFRSDLYFRLNGMTVTIPPLRERLDELADYARQFVSDTCRKLGRPTPSISEEAMRALMAHPWPGNLRELRNVMDRALVLAVDGPIERAHVVLGAADVIESFAAPPSSPWAAPYSSRPTLTDMVPPSSRRGAEMPKAEQGEKERITAALAAAAGNQTEAAKILGVSRRTLVYKLGYYDIPRPRKKGE